MTKEKQIEEMAEIILDVDRSYYGMECDEIQAKAEANAIYAKGYRLASEVAREIFEEFREQMRKEVSLNETMTNPSRDDAAFYEGRVDAYINAINALAELKKKYTEGEVNG